MRIPIACTRQGCLFIGEADAMKLTREPADDKTTIAAMQLELTPARVERAYQVNRIREVAREHQLDQQTMTALAVRWGIADG